MTLPYQSAYNPTPTVQSQQYFPQPQGNAYLINNSLEIANIPISGAITLALCTSENLLYVKSMQNGNPVFLVYKVQPYEKENPNKEYEDRITVLENEIQELKKGGKSFHELL